MLTIFNSLSGRKEPFIPLEAGKVKMYVCGMTVYDYCHIGHARVMVVFDMVVRYLRELGYEVTYVRNITDVDDKIIKRAAENDEAIESLTHRFINAMHEDAAALNVLPPDIEPRATQTMDVIIAMVQTLLNKDLAYQAANGDVYYSVSRFPEYGKLSRESLDEQRAGARVMVDEHKRDPLDFVLWKAVEGDEPAWDSPWGKGRPGWHIECSAMSTNCLGHHFDIHGGGMDLKFPHHENEIAQSEGASGGKFVNVWMHNGFVQINEEKMSKSLGNFFTVREVLGHYRPEVIRYFILASHYRSPLNYSTENLDLAEAALGRFYTALRGVQGVSATIDRALMGRFHAAMEDDFNTPEALAVMFEATKALNRAKDAGDTSSAELYAKTLRACAGTLGLLVDNPEEFLRGGADSEGLQDQEIDTLIAQRNVARQAKNWAEGDRIRDVLKDGGVVLEDGPGGTTWRRS